MFGIGNSENVIKEKKNLFGKLNYFSILLVEFKILKINIHFFLTWFGYDRIVKNPISVHQLAHNTL